MANDIERSYHGGDAYMLEAGGEMQAQFLLDLLEFGAFDSKFDSSYASTWSNRINTCLGYKTDTAELGEQKGETVLVQAAMKNCREVYNDTIYFAKKAFKGNAAVLSEFGIGKLYKKASNNQPYMVTFFENLKATANKYTTQLLAADEPQAKIDAIADALTQIHDANLVQNATKPDRPNVSRQRVIQLNDAYSPMAQVMEAAKRMYKDNGTKLGQYTYNPPIHHNPQIETNYFLLSGEVATIDISIVDGLTIGSVQFEAQQTDFDVYSSSAQGSQPGPITIHIASGTTVLKSKAEFDVMVPINGFTPYLLAKNTGAVQGTIKLIFIKA